MLKCIYCPSLEILTRIGGEWWFGQAQNGVNFEFEVKFDLEGQGQLSQKTIGILTKVFCFSGPNLVILAWTIDELSLGQAHDWRTHRHTDTQTHRHTQATTIPEGQNWPRVKISSKWRFHFKVWDLHSVSVGITLSMKSCYFGLRYIESHYSIGTIEHLPT